MSDGNTTHATVGGTQNGIDEVALAGARVSGILTLGSATLNLAFIRKVRLKCMTIDPTGGASILVTSLVAGDVNIIKGTSTLSAAAAATVVNGIAGTEFGQSFTECASSIEGYCLPSSIPLQVAMFNFSVATTSVSVMVSARTLEASCQV